MLLLTPSPSSSIPMSRRQWLHPSQCSQLARAEGEAKGRAKRMKKMLADTRDVYKRVSENSGEITLNCVWGGRGWLFNITGFAEELQGFASLMGLKPECLHCCLLTFNGISYLFLFVMSGGQWEEVGSTQECSTKTPPPPHLTFCNNVHCAIGGVEGGHSHFPV